MHSSHVKRKLSSFTFNRKSLFAFTLILSLLLLPMAGAYETEVGEFEEISLFVVYSNTDADAQIIVGGEADGISKLIIFGPNGCVRLKANFRDKGKLGQADFQFDTPAGTVAIRFEIEDEEEVAIKADLPGDATEFEVPNNWLRPGVEYTMDIKLIEENGNQTVRDVRFITEE